MKHRLVRFAACAALSAAVATPAYATAGMDQAINAALAPVSEAVSAVVFYPIPTGFGVSMPFVLLWLITAALFFTLYFRFINVRGFVQGFRLIRGDFSHKDDPGEVTHFQALATALSGTVGLGNIAGVAIAISIGGPGATFWMIVAGLLGMSTKFAECTLGVKYRRANADCSISGGPMCNLSRGIAVEYLRLKRLTTALALLFALPCAASVVRWGPAACSRPIRPSSTCSASPVASAAGGRARAGCSG